MAKVIQAFPRGSGGGGAIFSYIDSTKTALNADWLKDKENNTIEPKPGLLYLILTPGEYYNSFYRFNETTNKYVLVDETEIIEISQADFDLLPIAQKNNGRAYFIPDANFENQYAAHTGFTPIGTVLSIMCDDPPKGYLICDGTVYTISEYPQLASYFETVYGSKNIFGGDGITTFAVPNMNSGANTTPIITLLPSGISPKFCIAFADIFLEAYTIYTSEPKLNGVWEDGSGKYQISITGTTISGTSGEISTGLNDFNIEYAELERFQVSNGTYVKNLLDSVAIKLDGTKIAMVADATSLFRSQTFYATINYKVATT